MIRPMPSTGRSTWRSTIASMISPTPGVLHAAFAPPVVRRALAFAVVVGAVLIGINHGDAILAGDVDAARLFKMGLTVVVPYVVSTWSSVAAARGG